VGGGVGVWWWWWWWGVCVGWLCVVWRGGWCGAEGCCAAPEPRRAAAGTRRGRHQGRGRLLTASARPGPPARPQGLRVCNMLEGGVTPLHTPEELKAMGFHLVRGGGAARRPAGRRGGGARACRAAGRRRGPTAALRPDVVAGAAA
jgi:hypothetical protein